MERFGNVKGSVVSSSIGQSASPAPSESSASGGRGRSLGFEEHQLSSMLAMQCIALYTAGLVCGSAESVSQVPPLRMAVGLWAMTRSPRRPPVPSPCRRVARHREWGPGRWGPAPDAGTRCYGAPPGTVNRRAGRHVATVLVAPQRDAIQARIRRLLAFIRVPRPRPPRSPPRRPSARVTAVRAGLPVRGWRP